jgi:hypothetical protein
MKWEILSRKIAVEECKYAGANFGGQGVKSDKHQDERKIEC